jgi:hypothetical protein
MHRFNLCISFFNSFQYLFEFIQNGLTLTVAKEQKPTSA